MNEEDAIKAIEISSEFARSVVKKGEVWTRLLKNRDFKKAILDGYFKEESERLVGLLADPEFADEKSQQMLTDQMKGIAYLRMKIVNDQRAAHQMRMKLEENEKAIADIESGELNLEEE